MVKVDGGMAWRLREWSDTFISIVLSKSFLISPDQGTAKEAKAG